MRDYVFVPWLRDLAGEESFQGYGNNQDMKFTAPTAMPTPKITPDKVRLAAPSPKANISPPTTIATNASPVAIGPVKAVCNACTACVQGEVVDWAKTSSASAIQVANVSNPFLRKRFGGLLRPAELGFEEFCIE